MENDELKNYKAKAEFYIRQHQDNIAIAKLKTNKPLTPADVAETMNISIENASLLFHRDDFPPIMNVKNMLVLKDAFFAWVVERRE